MKEEKRAVKQKEELQYTVINHKARKVLKLTVFEYCVFDSIYNLSNDPKYKGWCVASLTYIADFLVCNEKTVRRAREKGINEGLLKIPSNKKGLKDNRTATTQLWYDTVIIDKTRAKVPQSNRTKCPSDLDKMSTKTPTLPDKMSNYNDNVNKEINKDNVASLFKFFKIPEKDQLIWMAVYKNEKDYLLKQLLYAKEKENIIKDPVKWIQKALDNDYASSDSAEIDKRESEWQAQKDLENARAEPIPGLTCSFDTDIEENPREKIKQWNIMLMECRGHPEIVSKIREMIKGISAGMGPRQQQEKYQNEIEPLIQNREREPVPA